MEDASDRAQKRSKSALTRVPLREITFWEQNRGGAGIISNHVHEVAHDCKANKTKLERYNFVCIVEIPSQLLEKIRDNNRARCEHDSLLPMFCEDAKYVCLTKTHFIHAHKLAQDGNRYLFNENSELIRWKEDDDEGQNIRLSGPLCKIFDSKLFEDIVAMEALAQDDNLNAAIQMGEDEMQAFGRVSAHMQDIPTNKDYSVQEEKAMVQGVIAKIQVTGMGSFSAEDWKAFILLKSSLPSTMAKILQVCQFNACAGRVRVKAEDFGRVASLDPRTPWAKVALLLWQYISNMNVSKKTTSSFSGCTPKVAQRLQPDIVKELVAETAFVLTVDAFIYQMLQHYGKPTGNGMHGSATQSMHIARGDLIANQGRYMLKVAHALLDNTRKSTAVRKVVLPDDRLKILEDVGADACAKAEDAFRTQLVNEKLYAQNELPAVIHPFKKVANKTDLAPSPATLPTVKQEPPSTVLGQGPSVLEARVFSRLGVTGLGEDIIAYIRPEPQAVGAALVSHPVVAKTEPDDEIDLSVPDDDEECLTESDDEGREPQQVEDSDIAPVIATATWVTVRLRSLCPPNAVVEVMSSCRFITVSIDDLRPLPKVVGEKPVILHPSMLTGGKTLRDYDYQSSSAFVAQIFAQDMILKAHQSVISCVENLSVHMLSEQGKTPLILQVRTKEAFKIGTLFLTPAYGAVIAKDSHINYHGSLFEYYSACKCPWQVRLQKLRMLGSCT